NAVVHCKRAELEYAGIERTNSLHENRQQRLCKPWLRCDQLAKRAARHRGDKAVCPRLHARGTRSAVNGSVLAENLAGAELTKAHVLPTRRVDSDANLTNADEKYIVRGVEIVDDRLCRLVAPPGATPLDPLDSIGR